MKPNRRPVVSLFLLMLLSLVPSLWAGARKVYVQGKLTDSGGAALSGAQTVTFKLYDAATAGTMVWTSGVLSVTPASGGLFNVPLQDGTPSLDSVSFDKPYFLGITVGADAEMAPRQELGASALSHGSLSDFQVKNNLIMTSGKFGIGTASPGTPVHIVAPAVQMTVEGTANQSVQMELIDHQSNAKKWRLVSGMNNRGGLQIYQATNNIEAVEISPNGNVGLGMVVPSDKLDVAGNIRLSGGAKSILFSDPGNYDFSIVHNGGSSLDIRSPEYNTTIASFFNNGNVGIGTNNPVDLLHLLQTNSSGLRWERAGYDTYRMGLMGQGFSVHNVTRNRYDLVIDGTTGNVGMGMTNPAYRLDVSGTIRGVVISPSDRNLKKNIHPMTPDTLDKVTRLNGKSFEWDKNRITSMREEQLKKSGSHSQKSPVVDEPSADFPMGPQLGLIAQEVEELFPQLVQTDNNGVKSISYMGITAVLVEGMKTQQKQIVALREEVSQLKKKLK